MIRLSLPQRQESRDEIEVDEGHGFEESAVPVDLSLEIPRVGNCGSRFVQETRTLLSFEKGTCGSDPGQAHSPRGRHPFVQRTVA